MIKKIAFIVGLFSIANAAHANEILLTSKSPVTVTYRLIQGTEGEPIVGKLQRLKLAPSQRISAEMQDSNYIGLSIVSVNGHKLPRAVNDIQKPKQCAILTDATHQTGALEIDMKPHKISCASFGGVFG